jgi:hypothetical protein
LNGHIIAAPTCWTKRACLKVKGDASHQVTATRTMAGTKITRPLQELSWTPANIMFRLVRAPVMNTRVTCASMKSRNHHNARKWIVRARCRLRTLPNNPNRFEIAGPCMNPVTMEVGAATKTVVK